MDMLNLQNLMLKAANSASRAKAGRMGRNVQAMLPHGYLSLGHLVNPEPNPVHVDDVKHVVSTRAGRSARPAGSATRVLARTARTISCWHLSQCGMQQGFQDLAKRRMASRLSRVR
jgi:hypothetical protein